MHILQPQQKPMSEPQRGWLMGWVLHDMCMRYFDRKHAFHSLLRLGYDARQAAELIQSYEQEG